MVFLVHCVTDPAPRSFEDGDLQVRLFHRASDQRARIYCRVSRNGRFVKECCLPLTKLSIQRDASTLKLYLIGESGRLKDIWVRLRFPSYERTGATNERQDGMSWLIWMFRPCALPLRIDRPKIGRRREAGRIVQRPGNARGERYIRRVGLVHPMREVAWPTTASKIRDDEFQHALRVYRDRDCGGIRLQASVLRGELKR